MTFRHATDRVDGVLIAECPNKDHPDDGHLRADVEYSDAVDSTLYEEFVAAFPTCGKCGAELDYLAQETPSEVLD